MTDGRSVAHRVAIATATNIAGQSAALLTSVILAAVILQAVGTVDYAVWALIGSIASFAFLLELGISSGLVKYVAEHAARNEADEVARMLAAATWLYALLGAFVCGIGIVFALALPAAAHLSGHAGRLVRPLTILTSLDVGISMIAIAPIAVLKGLQRFPTANALVGAGAVLGSALTVAALATGRGIVGVAAAGAVNSLAIYAMSLVVLRRTAPAYMATAMRPDARRARRLLRFSRSVALSQVALRLQTSLDVVVIAAALPIRLVTPYNFAQRLADGTGIATDQFGKVLLPLATEISTTREHVALRMLYLTATRLTLLIALGVGIPVVLLGGPILEIWVGHQFAGYGTLVALLALASIIDLPSYPAAAILQSIERHGIVAWIALGSGIVNLGLSILFVRPFGVEGVAAATLVASSIEICAFVLPYTAHVLNVSAKDLFSAVIVPLAVPVAVIIGLTLGGAAILPVTSLVRLAAVVGVGVGGYGLAYALLGAGPQERTAYRSAIAAVIRLPGIRRARTAPLDIPADPSCDPHE